MRLFLRVRVTPQSPAYCSCLTCQSGPESARHRAPMASYFAYSCFAFYRLDTVLLTAILTSKEVRCTTL